MQRFHLIYSQLHTYKSSYVTMREVVDHFFPPVGLLVTGGGEDFTDFSYWREAPSEVEDSSDAESQSDDSRKSSKRSLRSEDEGSDGLDDDGDEDVDAEMTESFLSPGIWRRRSRPRRFYIGEHRRGRPGAKIDGP